MKPKHPSNKVRNGLAVACALLLTAQAAWSGEFLINFVSQLGGFDVFAREIHGRIYVDASRIAAVLGAKTYQKSGIMLFEFDTHTTAVHPSWTFFSVQERGQTKWHNKRFPKKAYLDDGRVMVPMESIPEMFRKSFLYHRQKKELSLDRPEGGEDKDYQTISPRLVRKDGKIWVSVDDMTRVLGLVMYSAQSRRYSIVMPDFTVLEIRVGQKGVYKRNRLFIRLDDPVLLFSGSPYITFRSINSLFNFEPKWYPKSRKLGIPTKFNLMQRIQPEEFYKIRYVGYTPEHFKVDIEEFSSYYQEPEPTFSAAHWDVYESVRDFLTNDPIIPKNSQVEDRISGEGVGGLSGSIFGAPLEGRGSFEKIGGTGRMSNGTLSYGFPLLRISGGREFETMNNLNNQFNLVDQVTLSHSSDHYGDGNKPAVYDVSGTYGETEFSVFLSTSLFSQVVDFKQMYSAGRLQGSWKLPHRQNVSLKFEHYVFENDVKGVSSVLNDLDFFREILGDDFPLVADPTDVSNLTKTLLTDRHQTSFGNLTYEAGKFFELNGVMGRSFFDDPSENDKRVVDQDWLVRTAFKKGLSRIDLSYEEAGDQYRAMGSPLRYQARDIFRVAPYFDFSRVWKLSGEYRREDTSALQSQGIAPYTNIYANVVNQLNFKRNLYRVTGTTFRSSSFGNRSSLDLDYTRLLGRNTLDLGTGASEQRDINDEIFRRSYSGRTSFQVIRSSWSVGIGEEYTHHDYPQHDIQRWESLSNLLLRVKKFHMLLQYERKPRYFLEDLVMHTGFVRMGYEVGESRNFNLFYSVASLNSTLKDPEAWRAGLELVYKFR